MKTGKQQLTCIECPQGCMIEWEEKGQEIAVSGHSCPQGEKYTLKEVFHPARTLTSTVATAFADFPRLPVRTAGEIPLKDIFVAMEIVNSLYITDRLAPGDVIIPNLVGSGVALIATGNMRLRRWN
jgi:CxxC motif-containing protein